MLQYRVLRIHIEQIVRLRKTVLVPTILAVTANWTLVVRVGWILWTIIPSLVHCDPSHEQRLSFRRQFGQFGKERIEISYRPASTAHLQWYQHASIQTGVIAAVVVQNPNITSARSVIVVGLFRLSIYQNPYTFPIACKIVLLSQREIDFNVLCHVLFVHGHFSSYSFLWFYPNNSCSALIARSTPAANSSSVLPWNARFLRTSSWYAGFISSGQWPAPEI